MKIDTPIEFMLALEWGNDDLENAILYLKDWDNRSDEFYKKHKKINVTFDQAEREHYRNCINFWKDRLKHEN